MGIKKGSDNWVFKIVLLINLVMLFGISLSQITTALIMLPEEMDLTESFDLDETTIVTVINTEPRVETINFEISKKTDYLEKYVKIEPQSANIRPNENINIKIITKFPSNLSPEKHTAEIVGKTNSGKSSKFKLTFSVSGVANRDFSYSIGDVDDEKKTLILNAVFENKGNVIEWIEPSINIYEKENKSNLIDTIEYKEVIRVMPKSTYPLTLRYDKTLLKEGEYEMELTIINNGDLNDPKTVSFNVEKDFKKTNYATKNNNVIIIVIVVLVIAYIIFEVLKKRTITKNNTQQVRVPKRLDKRLKRIENSTSKIAKKTTKIITKANKFIGTNYGDEHEIK